MQTYEHLYEPPSDTANGLVAADRHSQPKTARGEHELCLDIRWRLQGRRVRTDHDPP